MFMFKLHNDNNFFFFSGFWLCMFRCYLFTVHLFICLFIYIFGEYLSGFFYHCVSIVISFDFISLVIYFIVELMFI